MASDTYNIPTNTTADAEAISATTNAVAAKDAGVALGGTNNKNNLGGEYNLSGAANLTINGAAGAEAIATKFADSLAKINDTASLDREGANQLVTDALGKVASLSESKQTDGLSSLGQLVLWGLGFIVAGLLIWRWRK